MHPMLNIAIKAARDASKIILRSFDRLDRITVTEKSRNEFVTEVDRASEQIIIETILKAYPNHSIMAEESGHIEGSEEYQWIIDPLDGTHNFIHGIPHFAISIAIQARGRIEHGLVLDPIRHELFTASRGGGARLGDRRVRVSACGKMDQALIGTGYPSQHDERLTRFYAALEAIHPQASDLRCSGSAALDLAYLAAGRLDGYLEFSLKPWDIAAGALMVREAGGIICEPNGGENYLQSGHIVAGTPKICKALLQIIQPLP
ncbi:MAG: inositol monophosphatase [Coxiellaceae bacterium]|nr:MAG: inositol monophosphatase [Coxiellaceae bacterium]